MRNFFSGKIRNMNLTEESIHGFLNEVNAFYGEDVLFIDNIELSGKYYGSIPNPDLDFYK